MSNMKDTKEVKPGVSNGERAIRGQRLLADFALCIAEPQGTGGPKFMALLDKLTEDDIDDLDAAATFANMILKGARRVYATPRTPEPTLPS